MRFPGGVVYKRRDVPRVGTNWMTRMVAWLANELGNVERALAYAPPKPITSNYTAQLTDGLILADASGGAISVTLPAVLTATGAVVSVKKTDASANAVTLTCVGSDQIDGSGTYALGTRYDSVTVQSDGTQYWVVGVVP